MALQRYGALHTTLQHNRLLQSAENLFGFTGKTQQWLASYLSNRSSYVAVGDQWSSSVSTPTGVPQGSVLGPVLFSIFTAPVGRLVTSLGISYHQYADDTQLCTIRDRGLTSSTNCMSYISFCADSVTRWFLENGLLLNPSKTEALAAGTRSQVQAVSQSAELCVAETDIVLTNKLRILGVTLDSHLSFDHHISKIVQSCNYHIRSLKYIRPLIDRSVANAIGCAIVSYRCSATDLLQQLHWLPVNQRIEYKILTIVYSVRHRRQPEYLLDLLTDYVPPRTLRSSYDDLLTVPSNIKTVTASRAFRASAPKLWNKLPFSVKSSCSFIRGF